MHVLGRASIPPIPHPFTERSGPGQRSERRLLHLDSIACHALQGTCRSVPLLKILESYGLAILWFEVSNLPMPYAILHIIRLIHRFQGESQ